jgi:Lipocalin-like domain
MKLRRREFLRLIAGAAALPTISQVATAQSNDAVKQLVGSWKLTSWIIQVIGESATEPLGPNPKGRLVITPDGYMAVIVAAANRKAASSNDERAALLNSLFAYTGKVIVEGDKFTTKVDASWNEVLTGQDQVRFFKVEGDKLSIRTAEQVSAIFPGKKNIGILTWERER